MISLHEDNIIGCLNITVSDSRKKILSWETHCLGDRVKDIHSNCEHESWEIELP